MGIDRSRWMQGGWRVLRLSGPAGLGIGLTALVVACGGSADAPGQNGAVAAEREPDAYVKVVNVETLLLERGSFDAFVRLTGSVEAYDDVVVSAEEVGRIARVLVEKGTRVRAGQPLMRINDDVIKAQVEEARAQAELARERYERQRRVWEEEGIGSEIAYLRTRYESQAAAARLGVLEARWDRFSIRSPIAGVLDERFVDEGELVGPASPVVRILNVARLKVVGGVPERFGPYVVPGATAEITFDVLPGRVFPGSIGFVGNAVDSKNRTFPVEVVMENPEQKVKPAMIANVRVATQRLEDVIVVPRGAVLRTEDGHQVFVITESGDGPVAEPREVELGPAFENRVVVQEGLEAGERLVVRGQQMVDPGDRVRVVNEEDR